MIFCRSPSTHKRVNFLEIFRMQITIFFFLVTPFFSLHPTLHCYFPFPIVALFHISRFSFLLSHHSFHSQIRNFDMFPSKYEWNQSALRRRKKKLIQCSNFTLLLFSSFAVFIFSFLASHVSLLNAVSHQLIIIQKSGSFVTTKDDIVQCNIINL